MLTNNAKKLLLYGLMNSGTTGTSNPYPASKFTLTNTEGTELTTTGSNAYVPSGFVNALNHMSTEGTSVTTYIKCGTGTTEATESDYNLEAEATDLGCDSVATAVGSNDAKTYTATFSNAAATDITVTEIGFFVNTYYSGDTANFLLDHIILGTPITIPAGESRAVTYEIGF